MQTANMVINRKLHIFVKVTYDKKTSVWGFQPYLFQQFRRKPAECMGIIMKKVLIAGHAAKTANYEKALTNIGARPVTSLHVPCPDEYDALLLPGGGDIDPVLFGQMNNGSRDIDAALDRIQLMILKEFVWGKKPVLGICKGIQLINIFFGGDLIQHLPSYKSHEYSGRDQVHKTHAADKSFLASLYGREFSVNSAHHQGLGTAGRNISFVQYAEDGVVEGLCHDTLPVIGVQWHPERMCFDRAVSSLPDGSRLLEYFLSLER